MPFLFKKILCPHGKSSHCFPDTPKHPLECREDSGLQETMGNAAAESNVEPVWKPYISGLFLVVVTRSVTVWAIGVELGGMFERFFL